MSNPRVKPTFIQLVILYSVQIAHMAVIVPNIRLMIEFFHQTYLYAGILMGLYMLLSGLASVLWALYSDMKGIDRKILIAIGLAGNGILTLVCYMMVDPYSFAFFYILAGMSASVVGPLTMTIIMDMFRSEERTETLMFYKILGGVGYVLGFGLGIALGASYNQWKEPLFIVGVISLIIGVPTTLTLAEPPKGYSEKKLHAILKKRKRYPFTLKPEDIKIITGTRSNYYITLQGIFGTIASGAIEIWTIQYLVREGGASEVVASAFLGLSVLGAIGGIQISRLTDRLYTKRPKFRPLVAGICTLVETMFFLAFFLIPIDLSLVGANNIFSAIIKLVLYVVENKIVGLCVALFFLGMVFNSSVGPIRNSAISDVNLPEHRATVLSGINIVEIFSKSIGTMLLGVLIDYFGSFRIPLLLAVSLWFVSGIYWLKAARHYEKDLWKIGIILEEKKKLLLQEK